MRTRSLLLALAFAAASPLAAQMPVQRYLEIRPQAGAMIPVGTQADYFKSAAAIGAQTAVELTQTFHVVGSFNWSPGNAKMAVPAKGLDIFQYDAGAEFSFIQPITSGWDLKPFVGVGAGARTYAYDDASLDNKTFFVAYGAMGTEFQYRMVALRLEARGYNYSFEYRPTDSASSRYDLGLAFGVAYHVHR